MESFITEYIWTISASAWLFIKKSITMYGNIDVKKEFFKFESGNFLKTVQVYFSHSTTPPPAPENSPFLKKVIAHDGSTILI